MRLLSGSKWFPQETLPSVFLAASPLRWSAAAVATRSAKCGPSRSSIACRSAGIGKRVSVRTNTSSTISPNGLSSKAKRVK